MFKFKKTALAYLLAGAAAYANETITVWCWDDNFNIPAAKLAGEKFAKTHPDVTVNVESVANDQTIQKMNAALGAKNLKGLPDIVLIEDYRVQNFLNGYPGFLKDQSATFKTDNFVDSKIAASSDKDGKHYGVPFDSGVSTVFVRLDLFEQAGYKLEDLEDMTWDKFIEMGVKVKEKTGKMLMPYDPSNLMELSLMMQSGGEWYTLSDGNTVNIKDNKTLREAFKTYKKVNDAGVLLAYSGWSNFLNSFQGDQVAAVVSSCWLAPSVMANEEQKGKWRIVKLPKLDLPNASTVSNQGGSQWYVNSYSKNADLAAEFLGETFGSDKDFINELIPRIQLISTMKGAESMPNYQAANEFFGGQPILKMMAQWNTEIPPVNYGQHSKAIESVVQEALQRYLGGEDLDAVLAETEELAKAQIGQ